MKTFWQTKADLLIRRPSEYADRPKLENRMAIVFRYCTDEVAVTALK